MQSDRHGDGEAWQLTILFDGDCPLCAREIEMLRRLDRGRDRIRFEDIATPAFEPTDYGVELETLMDHIHGALPDGTLVTGVEVFRRAYAAVGLGWLLAPTRWPGLRWLADAGYRVFARNRLRWTGRGDECESGRCGIPRDDEARGPRMLEPSPRSLPADHSADAELFVAE